MKNKSLVLGVDRFGRETAGFDLAIVVNVDSNFARRCTDLF